MADIDAVVLGKAPDLFEGVMKPELYLSDALGAVGQADVPRAHRRLGGRYDRHRGRLARPGGQTPNRAGRRVREAVRRQRPVRRSGAAAGASLGAGGAFAPFIRAYIHRSGAPEHIGWKVAVKDRLNALKNPYAHLRIEDISIEKVKASPMMWEPIRFLESCPSSDGACAIVLTDEAGGNAAAADGRPPAWVLGSSSRSEPPSFPGRDPVRPVAALQCAADVYEQAGITDPSPTDRHGRAVRALLVARAHLAGGLRPRRRGRGVEAGRRRRPPSSAARCRSTPRAACCRATRSVPQACSASPRPPTRFGARPASTRSTGPRWPSAWPTAPTASTSAPGPSAARCSPSADPPRQPHLITCRRTPLRELTVSRLDREGGGNGLTTSRSESIADPSSGLHAVHGDGAQRARIVRCHRQPLEERTGHGADRGRGLGHEGPGSAVW